MRFLLDIPFVLPVGKWIWGTEDDTAELCIISLPLMSQSCWTTLIVKGLGIAIILGACLNKAPVMFNIYQSKSTEGLSKSSIYGELIMYTNGALYGILQRHPFTAFGENVALVLQCIVIIGMMWTYSSITTKQSMQERFIAGMLYTVFVVGTCILLPTDMQYMLASLTLPVLLYSRGTQVVETFRIQHTGAQSIVTTSMNLVGTLIRILTTIKEVGYDLAVLSGFGLSLILNTIMFFQYFYYQKNTEKFLSELRIEHTNKKEK